MTNKNADHLALPVQIDFNPEDRLYYYRVTITKITDGDTLFGVIDLGMGITFKGIKFGKKKRDSYQAFRFSRINALETSLRQGQTQEQKEKGLIAKEFVKEHIAVNSKIIVRTSVAGGLRRPLTELFIEHKELGWIRFNDYEVQEGHAFYKVY